MEVVGEGVVEDVGGGRMVLGEKGYDGEGMGEVMEEEGGRGKMGGEKRG